MVPLLLLFHVALISTVAFPMFYSGGGWPPSPAPSPLGEVLTYSFAGAHRSVLVAALPALLAAINIPLLVRFRRPGRLWPAVSSIVLGLCTMGGFFTLSQRYGYGRMWGVDAAYTCGVLLTLAGIAILLQRARRAGAREQPAS